MTKNQKMKIDSLINALPKNDQSIYRDIAEYAVKLGYTPSQIKNVHGVIVAVAFSKSKAGRRLLKISPHESTLSLAFFASSEYSDHFQEKIRQDIDKGIVCTKKCENCAGKYTYDYSDGRKVHRCAIHSLVHISPIGVECVGEVKAMMKIQDDFWYKQNR